MFYFSLKQFLLIFLYAVLIHIAEGQKNLLSAGVFCASVCTAAAQLAVLAACTSTAAPKRKEQGTGVLGYGWEKFSLVQPLLFMSSLESSHSVCPARKRPHCRSRAGFWGAHSSLESSHSVGPARKRPHCQSWAGFWGAGCGELLLVPRPGCSASSWLFLLRCSEGGTSVIDTARRQLSL